MRSLQMNFVGQSFLMVAKPFCCILQVNKQINDLSELFSDRSLQIQGNVKAHIALFRLVQFPTEC
jgi:hypothetical protein